MKPKAVRVSVYIKRPAWWKVWAQPELFLYCQGKWYVVSARRLLPCSRQRLGLKEGFHLHLRPREFLRANAFVSGACQLPTEPFYLLKLLVSKTGRPWPVEVLNTPKQAWAWLNTLLKPWTTK